MVLNKNEIVCFDIETTGLDKYNDEILQIAIIDGNYKVLFNSYIKPKNHVSWPEAQKINNISPKIVSKAPMLLNVKDEVISILNQSKLIIGYNLKRFDIPFIEAQTNSRITSKTFDVMKYFKCYINSNRNQKLSVCCDYFNIKNVQKHDSLGDANATLECFFILIQEFEKKNIFFF